MDRVGVWSWKRCKRISTHDALKRKNNEVHVRSLFLASNELWGMYTLWLEKRKKKNHFTNKKKTKKQEKILKFPH